MVRMMEKAKNSKPVPWNMTGTRKGQRQQEPGVRAKPEAGQGDGGRSRPGAVTNSSPAAFEESPAQGKPHRKGSGLQNPAELGSIKHPVRTGLISLA